MGTRIKVLKTFLNWLKNHGYPVNPEFEKYKVYKENPQIVYLNQKELALLKKKKFSKKVDWKPFVEKDTKLQKLQIMGIE